ncbi:uncharacterized protein Eint_110805 [Encephalitozoon intestinalis ATCC 50506]|uniref:Uncharacterized protein n=1 Tax=Encephalitozoon intestinalis (strain ATCC 50506) TaxID=876142 RepID=W8Q232_ENCIT|nr:uncharacterized protein Eint_110805 [Encephalitozoon intestinalis ATCC 50506]AHL30169.1 hypothetical protein Eint_110805 [Encephalitozoon intestinalis ATCC 50506]UTX46437.1 hypothetical protein GPK93_11g20470 [Encephalitozoon intestinalis]
MNKKFMSSGVFQFLDEVYEQDGPLVRYGVLVGKGELIFDETLITNRTTLYNVLKKTEKGRYSSDGLMDW